MYVPFLAVAIAAQVPPYLAVLTLAFFSALNAQARNRMIAMDVEADAESGPCIVLTDRKEHAEALASMIRGAAACHGGIPQSEQQERIKALGTGGLRVLVATGQLLGEGFDCRELAALFLASPIRFSGRLIQYLGRVSRSSAGKFHAKVYDYVDTNVPTLVSAAKGRAATYRKLARELGAPHAGKEGLTCLRNSRTARPAQALRSRT